MTSSNPKITWAQKVQERLLEAIYYTADSRKVRIALALGANPNPNDARDDLDIPLAATVLATPITDPLVNLALEHVQDKPIEPFISLHRCLKAGRDRYKRLGDEGYEHAQQKIARVLLDRGADVFLEAHSGYNVIDIAWHNCQRLGACSEIVLHAISRKPHYQPDFPDLFLSIAGVDEASTFKQREDMAGDMMALGRHVSQRLRNAGPCADSKDRAANAARMALFDHELSFWLDNPWTLDVRTLTPAPTAVIDFNKFTRHANLDLSPSDAFMKLYARKHTQIDIARTSLRKKWGFWRPPKV